ncbi:MAG TPA: hypothetical protein VLV83_04520 [Acidobacteriota bacterium]|nr:hypothetical protein [Acidobacteriota bacterium]
MKLWLFLPSIFVAAIATFAGPEGETSLQEVSQPESPLIVKRLSPRMAKQSRSLELFNASALGITAYSLEFSNRRPDGKEMRSVLTEDFAVTAALDNSSSPLHRFGILRPGQSKIMVSPSGDHVSEEDRWHFVRVKAIVFVDRSWFGDEEKVKEIFLTRESSQLVRHHWLERIDDILRQPVPPSQLRIRVNEFKLTLDQQSEIFGNSRVSSTDHSAVTTGKGIAAQFERALEAEDEAIAGRLEALRAILEEEFLAMSSHVRHGVDGEQISDIRSRR